LCKIAQNPARGGNYLDHTQNDNKQSWTNCLLADRGDGGFRVQRTDDINDNGPITEMAIVNTFTRLIFGEEEGYASRELLIIEAFRAVDANVLRDSQQEMGEYLRNLGVREMIQLVSRLRQYLQADAEAQASRRPQVVSSASTLSPGAKHGPR
jgi:hypothetical protein